MNISPDDIANDISQYLEDAAGDIGYDLSRRVMSAKNLDEACSELRFDGHKSLADDKVLVSRLRKNRNAVDWFADNAADWFADYVYNDQDTMHDLIGDRLYDLAGSDTQKMLAVIAKLRHVIPHLHVALDELCKSLETR